LIITAKDWILEIWDILYGYVIEVYATLYQVYEFVLEISLIVVEFLKTLVTK
jgi:hypothetical protein